MKRLATLAAIALLACTFTFAQGESTVRRTAGSTALLFTLTGLGEIGASDFMGGVGFNHFLGDDVALRAGIGFSNSSETTKPTSESTESVESSTSFAIAPGIRFNLARNNNIAMYVGGQVAFGMTSGATKVAGEETESNSSTMLGVGAFAGAEWFPWNNVSLGLEYGLGFSTESGKSKQGTNGTEVDSPSTTTINLGLSTIQFVLGFYFN